MKIYVVRHGETIENAKDILIGRMNTSLSYGGVSQAFNLKDYFKDKNIDLIVSSPLERCSQTAEIISDGNIDIIYDQKLLGRNHGEFTGGKKKSVNFEDYWNYYRNTKYEYAESVRDLFDRAVNFVLDLKNQYGDKNIILVTHSGIIRVLYYYFKGIPEDGNLSEVEIKNCSVYEYDI